MQLHALVGPESEHWDPLLSLMLMLKEKKGGRWRRRRCLQQVPVVAPGSLRVGGMSCPWFLVTDKERNERKKVVARFENSLFMPLM